MPGAGSGQFSEARYRVRTFGAETSTKLLAAGVSPCGARLTGSPPGERPRGRGPRAGAGRGPAPGAGGPVLRQEPVRLLGVGPGQGQQHVAGEQLVDPLVVLGQPSSSRASAPRSLPK